MCINFGSMVSRDMHRVYDAVLAALTRTKQPGVIVTGWGDWQSRDIPANVLLLDAAPHDWLFPRMMAVIHHGGAGTTAAALRAGVPNIVVPFAADQPFWGHRVAQLNVGPPPIPAKQLHAERLEAAIRQVVEDTTLRQRAAEVARQLRTEHGVGQAITLIEHYYNRFGGHENPGKRS
jgi:UDP:flavonoid glycosyltransferase YjiC (YdhE family)